MGTTKKLRKKIVTPSHPWERSRLEKEAKLKLAYGTRRKRELWKMNTILKNFKKQAKKLIALTGEQAELEKKQLIGKLSRLGLVDKDATMDTVLGVTLENLMDRRLQTKVFAMGLAKTQKQARQLIVHGHISINGTVISSPSYLVKVEDKLFFTKSSSFNNPDHPERINERKNLKLEKKEDKKETLKEEDKKPALKETRRKNNGKTTK